jgi:hypothetical protein
VSSIAPQVPHTQAHDPANPPATQSQQYAIAINRSGERR